MAWPSDAVESDWMTSLDRPPDRHRHPDVCGQCSAAQASAFSDSGPCDPAVHMCSTWTLEPLPKCHLRLSAVQYLRPGQRVHYCVL